VAAVHLRRSLKSSALAVLRFACSTAMPAVFQLSIVPGPVAGPALELQHQIHDYSLLISDPVCPQEMRDLLVLELGQIITALLLYCGQLNCVMTSEECMIRLQHDAAQ
jgi:hypothetical protein